MIVLIVLSLVAQQITRPSTLMSAMQSYRISLNANEKIALDYIHDNTPQNSVILAEKYAHQYTFPLSGLAGRAAYLEYDQTVYKQNLKLNPLDDRRQVIRDLWAASKPEQFCQILTATPTTHLIEYSSHPLLVYSPPCMQPIWESSPKNPLTSSEKVTIWKVNR